MKELHQAYGEIVYQAEIQNIRPLNDITVAFFQLIAKYGSDISGLLVDIYDDVVDHPADWAGYAA